MVQHGYHFSQHIEIIRATFIQPRYCFKHSLAILRMNLLYQFVNMRGFYRSQHVPYIIITYLAATKGNCLVQKAQGITHAAFRSPRNEFDRCFIVLD